MVAMQCVFCVFWQDSDNNGSDAMRVFYGRTEINGSDAMRVFLWQENDINGSDAVLVVYFSRTSISIVAMQYVFFMAGQRY